ncbi:MAG: flippase-like domain-containing protein [Bacteroidales bacterium]|nr:flippase-like domain-containing protein [Bacteroidales bacterium]
MTKPKHISSSRKSVKKDVRAALTGLFSLGVSVGLILWLFHKVDVRTILKVTRESCDYRWLLVMCLVLVASRSIRGIRWGIQLRAAGVKRMPAFAEMVSIYGAYALNLLLTGVGEAWRCVYVARRQRASFSTVVGTDLGDRISDAIMIVLLTTVAVIAANPVIKKFLDHYEVGRAIVNIVSSPILWIVVGVLLVIIIWLLCSHSQNRIIRRIKVETFNLWGGFKVLFTMKHQVRFWFYTLLIWIAYFLLTYLSFFAFPFTRALVRPELSYGLLPGLVVFVFGSLSIAIPASGGLGPWNLAVIFALSLYGVDSTDAATFAMVVWAFQTVTQVLLGVVSAGYVVFDHHKRRVSEHSGAVHEGN